MEEEKVKEILTQLCVVLEMNQDNFFSAEGDLSKMLENNAESLSSFLSIAIEAKKLLTLMQEEMVEWKKQLSE